MRFWKKGVSFFLCICLLIGCGQDIFQGGICVVDAEEGITIPQENTDSKPVFNTDSTEENTETTGISTETTETTQKDPATTETKTVYISKLQYSQSSVEAGMTEHVSISCDLNAEQVKDGVIFLDFSCRTDCSSITAECGYIKDSGSYEGDIAITGSMEKGEYYLSGISYFDKVSNKKAEVKIAEESKLPYFFKMDEKNTAVTTTQSTSELTTTESATTESKITAITLSSTKMTMQVNAMRTLTATVTPDTIETPKLSWSSSKESVAVVNEEGVVTAKKKGSAVITCQAEDGSGIKATCKITVKKNLVIVLDPGHGNRDMGAVNRSKKLYERNINLQIAKACRDYLEKYEGVTVYLTRETNQGFLGLAGRAQFAKACDADVFISLHINASASRRAKGAEVWVTRSKYKSSYNSAMTKLANKILTNLSGCGLQKRGVYTRKSSHLKYSFDGTRADYYGVIRNSIERGIPAMIVEHGFIDSSDYKYMNSAAKTKKLGIADAKAIASYYGLNMRNGDDEIQVSGIKLNVNASSLTLKRYQKYSLKATVAPSNAEDDTVSYSSSKTSVVSVSSSGKLTAKKKGTAKITCKAKDGSGVTRTLTVKVK